MDIFNYNKARRIYKESTKQRNDAEMKLKEWQKENPGWEDDEALLTEYDELYGRYDALDNLVDAADNYIYECKKLFEVEDELEFALTEAGWDNEK